jgi:hypothetical protein
MKEVYVRKPVFALRIRGRLGASNLAGASNDD